MDIKYLTLNYYYSIRFEDIVLFVLQHSHIGQILLCPACWKVLMARNTILLLKKRILSSYM
jgi:hypothetical protein